MKTKKYKALFYTNQVTMGHFLMYVLTYHYDYIGIISQTS